MIPSLSQTCISPQEMLLLKRAFRENRASQNDEFSFKITFTDKEGNPADWVFAYMKGEDMVEAGSEYEFTLKGGESLIVRDVPVGMNYKWEETDAKGYVSTSANAEGTVTANGATAEFVNTRNDIPKQATAERLAFIWQSLHSALWQCLLHSALKRK